MKSSNNLNFTSNVDGESRILNVTTHKEFGGGTAVANMLHDTPVFRSSILYLEKNASLVTATDQVLYNDVWAVLRCLRGVKKNKNIELIHTHGRLAGIFGRLCKLYKRQVKVVHTFHGINSFGPFKRITGQVLESFLTVFTDLVIFNSHYERSQYVLPLFCKSVIINNCVNDEKISVIRRDVFNTVGFCGSFAFPKKHLKVIDLVVAYNKRHRFSPLKLIFCGDGPDREIIVSYAHKVLGENFVYLGECADMRKFYSQIQVYIHFSEYESFCLAVAEAMANRIPCIVSKGVPIVEDSFTGFVVPLENIEEQTKVLEDLINDSVERNSVIENGFDLYQRNFTIKSFRNKHLRAYRDLGALSE
jgi:glycosyltransferase involved in cell wall biosynthesis